MKPLFLLWLMGILASAALGAEILFVARDNWAQGVASIDAALQQPAKTRLVTIHQTETFVAPNISRDREKRIVESIRKAHLKAGLSNNEKRLWGDIAYHYIIGPSGDVYLCRNPAYQSDSRTVLRADLEGNITICLIGDFRSNAEKRGDDPLVQTPDALPTRAAMESLQGVIEMELAKHDLDETAIKAHRDLAMIRGGSDCPGGLFYPLIQTELVPAIKARLAAQRANVKMR
jgi:hypothetical protein